MKRLHHEISDSDASSKSEGYSDDDGLNDEKSLSSNNSNILFQSNNKNKSEQSLKKRLLSKKLVESNADSDTIDNDVINIQARNYTTIPRKWTTEEDNRLREAISLYGELNWRVIANFVGTRDNVQCLQRWQKVIRPGLVKGQWSDEEDTLLTYLVSLGFKNWGKLASHMPGRTSKQCRERWCHHLDPNVKKSEYTDEEDKKILSLHQQLGNRWSAIAKQLPGRTENSIRSRVKALKSTLDLYIAPKELGQKESTAKKVSQNESIESKEEIDPMDNLKALQAAVLLASLNNEASSKAVRNDMNDSMKSIIKSNIKLSIPSSDVTIEKPLDSITQTNNLLNVMPRSSMNSTMPYEMMYPYGVSNMMMTPPLHDIDRDERDQMAAAAVDPFHYKNMYNNMLMMSMMSPYYPSNYDNDSAVRPRLNIGAINAPNAGKAVQRHYNPINPIPMNYYNYNNQIMRDMKSYHDMMNYFNYPMSNMNYHPFSPLNP
eukprot:gene18766-24533_t